MFEAKANFMAAFTACVLPFLLGDSLKIVLTSVLVNRLKPVLSDHLKKLTGKAL